MQNKTLVTVVMAGLSAVVVIQAIIIANLWLTPSQGTGAQQGAATTAVAKPSRIEAIPGNSMKRITLTPRAAERAGIKTDAVAERVVARSLVVPGEVVSKLDGDAAGATLISSSQVGAVASSGKPSLIVRVPYSGDTDKLDRQKPARILHLSRDDVVLKADPVEPNSPRSRRSKELYYLVEPTGDGGIHSGARVRVEVPHVGSDATRKVVPHSAIIYDAKGAPWVYTNPAPYAFVRESVDVDFIRGDLAVLQSGPASGTAVVSIGATLLWGVELGK